VLGDPRERILACPQDPWGYAGMEEAGAPKNKEGPPGIGVERAATPRAARAEKRGRQGKEAKRGSGAAET